MTSCSGRRLDLTRGADAAARARRVPIGRPDGRPRAVWWCGCAHGERLGGHGHTPVAGYSSVADGWRCCWCRSEALTRIIARASVESPCRGAHHEVYFSFLSGFSGLPGAAPAHPRGRAAWRHRRHGRGRAPLLLSRPPAPPPLYEATARSVTRPPPAVYHPHEPSGLAGRPPATPRNTPRASVQAGARTADDTERARGPAPPPTAPPYRVPPCPPPPRTSPPIHTVAVLHTEPR